MIFNDFEINAMPFFSKAYCKQCKGELKEVSNGFISRALFCPKCENIYEPKLVKIPKKNLSKEYLEQCRKEIGEEKK